MIISSGSSNPSTFSPLWLPLLLAARDPILPSLSPLPPSPPPECAKVTLAVKGWQMLSFNCIGNMSNTFEVLETAQWNTDDKIMTRDPFVKFASFNGERFVGGLINHDQLLPSLGYKIYYSGAEGAALTQLGLPQLPVEDVVLRSGWNWIGHAPLASYLIQTGIAPVGSEAFSADDQIKTRAGGQLEFTTYTGSEFQGRLRELKPGIGYEIKVNKQVTFRYMDPSSPSPSPPPPSPSPPPPSPPSPSPPPPSLPPVRTMPLEPISIMLE